MEQEPKVKQRNEQDQGNSNLSKEQELANSLLFAFEQNDVHALVILEKEERMCILSNGISGEALGSFLLDLSLKHPELLMGTMEALRSVMKINTDEAMVPRTIR